MLYLRVFLPNHRPITIFAFAKYVFLLSLETRWHLLHKWHHRLVFKGWLRLLTHKEFVFAWLIVLLYRYSYRRFVFDVVWVNIWLVSNDSWSTSVYLQEFIPDFLLDSFIVSFIYKVLFDNLAWGATNWSWAPSFWKLALWSSVIWKETLVWDWSWWQYSNFWIRAHTNLVLYGIVRHCTLWYFVRNEAFPLEQPITWNHKPLLVKVSPILILT